MLSLDHNKKYLLGCSYGPDSMALFDMLLKEDYMFDVAIVNYHLREESDDEVNGLRNFCKKNNKELFILDVKTVPTNNIEENCRNIRYEFFAELVRKNGYDGILVAHHQDDLLETYLMQKERQICPVFFGMKNKSHIFGIDVYRPLLTFSKADLLEYIKKNSVPFLDDKSNENIIFVRNKIRHNIVKKLTKKERTNLLKEIDEENEKLGKLLSQILLNKLNDVEYILSLDEISVLYALNMLKNQAGNYPDLSKKQCNEIIKILKSNKPNVTANILKDLIFIKEYGKIRFSGVSEERSYLYVIPRPLRLDTPYFFLDFTKGAENRNVTNDDYPLTVRNVYSNDVYQIKDYAVSVRRLLIDWKVPVSLRKKWPVIISKTGKIIYIPHYQKDFVPELGCNFYVKTK